MFSKSVPEVTGILNVRMATKTDGVAENRPPDRQTSGSDPKPQADVQNTANTEKGTCGLFIFMIVNRRYCY